MTRRSERKKAAKAAKAAPPPDFVHAAAGRVGPLVHGTADRIDPMAHSAADWVGAAADRVGPLAQSAADRVGPLTHAAADRVSPLALSAADRVGPYAQAAIGRVSPYAHLAAEKVSPLTSGAKQLSARAAQEALEKLGPQLAVALETGRHISDDLIPKLVNALSAAAGSPTVAEATRRGKATLAAAKGELVLPPPKKKRRWLVRFAILAALAGVAAVAARKFLGSADADWQAARPSAPYTPPQPVKTPEAETAPSVDDTAPTPMESAVSVATAADVADLTPAGDEPAEPPAPDSDVPTSDAPTADTEPEASLVYSTESDDLQDGGQPMDSQSNEASMMETELPIAPSAETASTPTSAGERPRYEGEGIYIGLEPPEGYTIKGNERSKKYHVPESAGYARTTAEVWFNSEEAAERAGFIRAQR